MKKYTILLLGFGMLLGIGCSNDAKNDLNNKGLSPKEVKVQMQVNNATEGLDELLAQLLINNTLGSTNKNGSDCAIFSFTEKSISVAYNTCTINGNILDGTLKLTAGYENVEGTKGNFVINFDAFSFNDHILEGTKSFTFDYSVVNRPIFTIVTDISIENAQGETIGHIGNKELTWHLDRPNGEGADFSCSGEWDIVHNGTTYSFQIIDPLSGIIGCAYITSGVLALEVDGLTASLDFGQGVCDQKGTVNYPNGKSEEISW